jgi:hypothetical protein
MTKVHCHSQEYWTVTPMKCQCGTAFTRKTAGIRRLYEHQSIDVDVLRVRCESCGREADLDFDISPFLQKTDDASFQPLLDDLRKLTDMCVWHEPGIEGALKYFSELAATGDVDALEYLADAAGHFLEKARELSATAPN